MWPMGLVFELGMYAILVVSSILRYWYVGVCEEVRGEGGMKQSKIALK